MLSMIKTFTLALLILSSVFLQTSLAKAEEHQPIVKELIALLSRNSQIKQELEKSLSISNRFKEPYLKSFYMFLDDMVVLIPTDRNANPKMLEFYYNINHSDNGFLQKDLQFQNWTHKFANEWGAFLDTPASATKLSAFYENPIFHIDDYDRGTTGWLTFNQFFYRHVKPGKRPIDGLCDDKVIVSPADSVIQGSWNINENSTITAKGLEWSMHDLLDGSPYQDRFKGGIYTHMFLNVNDYHRYHLPVKGKILEARKIHGKVVSDVMLKEDGTLDDIIGPTFQFHQERALIVIDSPVGLVAVLPIGMAQVSSVNLTLEKGLKLVKGDEIGYFSFGGSDVVVLFEANRVKITAKSGKHYKQGEAIAIANE